MYLEIIYLIYMHKKDLALDNLQRLICHKSKPNQTHGVVANVLDCDITVSEFEIESCYYDHFWTNIFGKDMTPIIPPAMG